MLICIRRATKRVRVSENYTWNPAARIQFAGKDCVRHNECTWSPSIGIRFRPGERCVVSSSTCDDSKETLSSTPAFTTLSYPSATALTDDVQHRNCTDVEKERQSVPSLQSRVHVSLSSATNRGKYVVAKSTQHVDHRPEAVVGHRKLPMLDIECVGSGVNDERSAAEMGHVSGLRQKPPAAASEPNLQETHTSREIRRRSPPRVAAQSAGDSSIFKGITESLSPEASPESVVGAQSKTPIESGKSSRHERPSYTGAGHPFCETTDAVSRKRRMTFPLSHAMLKSSSFGSLRQSCKRLRRSQSLTSHMPPLSRPSLGTVSFGASDKIAFHSLAGSYSLETLRPHENVEPYLVESLSDDEPRQVRTASSSVTLGDQTSSEEDAVDRTIVESTDKEEFKQPVYQIPHCDLRRDIANHEAGRESFWSHLKYRSPDGRAPSVRYCTTLKQSEDVADKFSNEMVIGFDMEWKINGSSLKHHVSVIQIACDDTIAVFHLALYRGDAPDELIGPKLRAILESPKVLKAGVNIGQDFKRVWKYLNIKCRGCFELSLLHNLISLSSDNGRPGRKLVSLAKQVKYHLLLPLRKGDVRTSDWSKKLNYEQVKYAAADAYAGFRLFHELEAKRRKLSPVPPRPSPVDAGFTSSDSNDSKHLAKAAEVAVADEPESEPEPEPAAGTQEIVSEQTPLAQGTHSGQTDSREGPAVVNATTSKRSRKQKALQVNGEVSDESETESMSGDLTTTNRKSILGGSVTYPDLTHCLQSLGIEEATTVAIQFSEAQAALTLHLSSANTWIDDWMQGLPEGTRPKSSKRQLQAYTLWHQQHMTIQQIAAMLKTPPLSQNTVISYILDAVRDEGLPYDPSRLRKLLPLLHQNWVRRRYWSLLKQLE